MNIPFFRNDAEAAKHAALHRPFEHAFGPQPIDYARRHGTRAAEAAGRCRQAAARGDQRALYLAQKALTTNLFIEKPELFEQRQARNAPSLSFPRKRESSQASVRERKESFARAGARALDPRFRGDDNGGRAA